MKKHKQVKIAKEILEKVRIESPDPWSIAKCSLIETLF